MKNRSQETVLSQCKQQFLRQAVQVLGEWKDGINKLWASVVAQTVKNPPAVRENWVQSLDWEDPLEEGMVTHSSILARKTPINRGAWRARVHGATKSQT